MKIALLEPYPEIIPAYLSYLTDAGHIVFAYEEAYDPSHIDAIIIRSKISVDVHLLQKYTSLRYVLRVGVGLERIDTVLLRQKGIQVINTPGSNSQAVAELVLRGILSLLRNTNKKWESLDDRFDMMGEEMSGRTIGLIGFGNIGRIVHNLVRSFGDNTVVVYDPYLDRSLLDDVDVQWVDSKEEVFVQSDILSFHIPLTEKTRNCLSRNNFALLKKNIKIINTSRGGIIDEDALIDFLSHNTNAGAYIDTREGEPANPKDGLMSLDNCIITPHLGSMTHEANKAMHKFNLPQA